MYLVVMKSGSKSRVQVEDHFSGSGRVWVTIFGFLSGYPQVFEFATINV